MLRRGDELQSVNIYVGGVGGPGGGSSTQGGSGGTGEGPTVKYDISAEAFTMHLAIQGQSHELSGPMRNMHHAIGAKYRPYHPTSHPRASLMGFNEVNSSSGSRAAFSMQTMPAFDPYSVLYFNHTSTPSSSTSPPFHHALFPSDPQLPHVLQYQQPINHTGFSDFLTLCQNHQVDWSRDHFPLALEHQHHILNNGTGSLGSGSHFGVPQDWLHDEPLQPIHNRASITINHHDRETGIYILHRMVALEALHNSAESFPRPKCHPETRAQLLDKLFSWATAPHSDCTIQWLHGPAGAGKSAVMQTLCQRLQDAGQLGGSFFFKRGHQACGNGTKLFTTLAYQLALYRHELRSLISQNIEIDPSVLGRGMNVQLGSLITEPCKALKDTTHLVLLIDGLDECEGHDIQQRILYLIGSTVKHHCLPLRILVASRPEPHIQETFKQESFEGLCESTNIEQSFEDIRIYLHNEFSRIHREHFTTMRQIPTPWPSPQILEALVQKSSGYFIYASTVIRFIDNEYCRPSKQLDIIQNLVPHDSESPFEVLDQLYCQILSGVPVRFYPSLCDILCAIINYPGLSAEEIDELLGLEAGDAQLILRPLHSVLKFSTDHGQIQAHHASFRDFLNNQERSSVFFIGSPQHRAKLARSILKVLAYTHDNPHKNRADHWFRWHISIGWPYWMDYIASIIPSADFVPLVRQVNPDFIFCCAVPVDVMERFLCWLKKIDPLPEDLIRRWEDYQFMHLYQHFQDRIACSLLDARSEWASERTVSQVWAPSIRTMQTLRAGMNSELQAKIQAFQQHLSQSPHLIRLLQTKSLLALDHLTEWIHIRIALVLSWDVVRECICSLRPLISDEFDFYLFWCLLNSLNPEPSVSSDLARGFIRLLQRIKNGALPMMFWWFFRPDDWHFRKWGRHIRSSPQPNPELLQELHQFIPPWDVFLKEENRLEPVEFYDVVQWLKISPDPQPDLIGCWQSYLAESMAREGRDYSDDELDGRWQDHLEREAYFHGPPDKKALRCWKNVLREYTSDGYGSEEEDDDEDSNDDESDSGDEDGPDE